MALIPCLAAASELYHVRAAHTCPLTEFDAMERASSARVLLQTGRFATLTLRPWELQGHEYVTAPSPWPVQVWSLGYPLLLAGAFALFGAKDAVVVALPVGAYILCSVLVLVLGIRLWGHTVAIIAGALFLMYKEMAYCSALGQVEPTYTALLLAAILLLVSRPAKKTFPFLAAGCLLGLMYFIRPTAIAWFPLVALAGVGTAHVSRRKALLAAAAGLACTLLVTVLLTRTLSIPPLPRTGETISYTKMMLLKDTPASIGDNAEQLGRPVSWGEVFSHRGLLISKLIDGVMMTLADIGHLLPIAVLLFAPLGMYCCLREPTARRLVGLLLIATMLGTGGCILTAFWSMERYTATFIPLLALVAAVGIQAIALRMREYGVSRVWRVAYVVGVTTFAVAPFAQHLHAMRALYRPAEGYMLAQQVATALPADAVILSPRAVDIAWHGGQRGIDTGESLSLPEILRIDAEIIRTNALILPQSTFGGVEPPLVLARFRRITSWVVPWRVTKGQPEFRTYWLYCE